VRATFHVESGRVPARAPAAHVARSFASAVAIVALCAWPLTAQRSTGPANGVLIVDGGGATEPVVRRFVELAGGRGAQIVVIPTGPSAIRFGDSHVVLNPDWPRDRKEWGQYEEYLKRWFGVDRVHFLHTRDRSVADSPEFVVPLKSATGVYLTPGNSGRYADAYLGTRTQAELKAVLDHGGVIFGSSAGAIIQGSFLVRGRPDKPLLMAPGRTTGFGFLTNVAINPHLTSAKRDAELVNVVDAHPHVLGIGIDDDAALLVRKNTFEVIGTGRVAIYDNVRRDGSWYYWLNPGERFDLATWTKIESPPARDARLTRVAATRRFELHSDSWINLHHFLYQWAREDRGLGTGRRHVSVPERAALASLPARERDVWSRAVSFYRDSVAARSHFDPEMRGLKLQLVQLGGDVSAQPPDRITGIAAALQQAMPVYRQQWWARHDSANRAWITSVEARLRRHEARFVELTERLYGARWPEKPWRVDVSAYANPRAGYTTAEGHVVIYATDRGNQDLYALETVLHEVQHADAVGGSIEGALARTFAAVGSKPPDNLWHALIFATAGEFVTSVASEERKPPHTPYWIKEGFESLDGWSALVPVVREHWLPAVRGETSSAEALAGLARALRHP
jgi:cyanophycinase